MRRVALLVGPLGSARCFRSSAGIFVSTRLLQQHDAAAGSSTASGPDAREGAGATEGTGGLGYDPWAILGLKPGASTNDIRLRYHDLMRLHHPTLSKTGGDPIKLAQINKAYDLVTKSPSLDRRFRNLVSDSQFNYYKVLPEWMARNVDEMPRYWSWYKWQIKSSYMTIILLSTLCFICGKFFREYPVLTTVMFIAFALDILLHTTMAPGVMVVLMMKAFATPASYDLSWLQSMKHNLQRDLSY
jgi:hypothetical protein